LLDALQKIKFAAEERSATAGREGSSGETARCPAPGASIIGVKAKYWRIGPDVAASDAGFREHPRKLPLTADSGLDLQPAGQTGPFRDGAPLQRRGRP
jgi:hypothetical protein